MPMWDPSSANTTTHAPGVCQSASTLNERMIVPVRRRVEVGELLPGEGALSIAADVYMPPRLRSPPTALFCLPGGALTRGYYDLQPGHSLQPSLSLQPNPSLSLDPTPASPQPADTFSFANSLAAHG